MYKKSQRTKTYYSSLVSLRPLMFCSIEYNDDDDVTRIMMLYDEDAFFLTLHHPHTFKTEHHELINLQVDISI